MEGGSVRGADFCGREYRMERLKLLRMKKEVCDIEERENMGHCADLEMHCR